MAERLGSRMGIGHGFVGTGRRFGLIHKTLKIRSVGQLGPGKAVGLA